MSMTLYQYRVKLGWSQRDLARESGVSPVVVSNAERGETISPPMAKKIADCLSNALGQEITPLDIEGLKVR